jgi:hypothetical protein
MQVFVSCLAANLSLDNNPISPSLPPNDGLNYPELHLKFEVSLRTDGPFLRLYGQKRYNEALKE